MKCNTGDYYFQLPGNNPGFFAVLRADACVLNRRDIVIRFRLD